MFVERRKDNYDELQILAGDVSTRRRRTNRWTTTLVAGTMAATAAYIGTTNSQVEALKSENASLTVNLRNAERERDGLRVERDVYFHYANELGDMYPLLTIADKMPLVMNPGTGGGGSADWPPLTISNLVWYVDGSRRFPMAGGDVLWIPEGKFSIRLNPGIGTELPTHITVNRTYRPLSPNLDNLSGNVSDDRVAESLGTFDLTDDKTIYEIRADKGGSNCAQLKRDATSGRNLGPDYVDIIVTFVNKPDIDDCGANNPEAVTR